MLSRRATLGIFGSIVSAVIVVVLLLQFLPQPVKHAFSFEDDMGGWSATGTDLEHDGGTLDWSIERSQDRASVGSTSLKFYLNNLNDAGKIWVERAFDVEAGRTYRVSLEYSLASSDFGSFNLWRIITGVLSKRPQVAADLEPTYQDTSGNGMSEDSGYVWLNKKYDFNVQADSDGKLWVVIGVWGTWETPRTYYIDGISVSLAPG